MDSETFSTIISEQQERSSDVLVSKNRGYATEDRLHSFRVAAELGDTSLRQALAGMMAKHTVSIYDMCKSSDEHSIAVWNEKITDHINYLLILRAVIEDERLPKAYESGKYPSAG